MYGIVRILIGVILERCGVFAMKKSKRGYNSKLHILIILLAIALITVLGFVPFENLFITFESPENVFNYFHGWNYDIELVVEGENCDMVIASGDDKSIRNFVPKTEDGWKIAAGITERRKVWRLFDNVDIYSYQYRDADEYFITIYSVDRRTLEIADSLNSEFFPIKKTNKANGETYVRYYANISDLDSQYWVSVDGEKVYPLSE